MQELWLLYVLENVQSEIYDQVHTWFSESLQECRILPGDDQITLTMRLLSRLDEEALRKAIQHYKTRAEPARNFIAWVGNLHHNWCIVHLRTRAAEQNQGGSAQGGAAQGGD